MNIFLDANICLDLLDTKRPTSEASIAWYMEKKDKDFEDLMVLNSAVRAECDVFMTNDKGLLRVGGFKEMRLGKIEGLYPQKL